MKKLISTLVCLITLCATGQAVLDLSGNHRNIRSEQLLAANVLPDLIHGFPVNWITSYQSVEITTTNKGVTKVATGQKKELSIEQKENLNTADLFTLINIRIKYVYHNKYSGEKENNTMDVSFYRAPEINAQFECDGLQIRDYLKKSVLGNENDTIPGRLGMAVVKFTVDENGTVLYPKIVKSSGDLFTDSRLLQAISKMPKWKPAKDKGINLKQDLQFSFGGC